MNITFREMKETDIAETIELCDLCFEEKSSLDDAKHNYESHKDDPYSRSVIGLTTDGRIVAHVRIQFIETMFTSMPSYAILNHVCVHPDYRRHQIGTELLEYVSDICRSRGVKEMKLWSNNYRVASHALYKSYGFSAVDTTFYTKELN